MTEPLHRKRIEQPPPEAMPEEDGFFAGTFKILLVCMACAVGLWIITIAVKASGFR